MTEKHWIVNVKEKYNAGYNRREINRGEGIIP